MEGFTQFVPMLAVLALMYFMLIKPQMDERKAHEALVASLAKDDWVVTQAGMHGRIVSVADETIVLEIDDRTKITLDKTFVARRLDGKKA